jgi:carbon monoxide dehydrogenase subunit G
VSGILYPLAVLAVLVLGAFGVGASLPVAHLAARSKRVPARPEVVWGLINDPVATKGWGGDAKTEIVEQDAPRLLTTKIVGEQAFGGTWTFEIAPEGHDASTVTITERGEVHNPFFRAVMRVMGHTRAIDGYLAKLERALT